MVLNEMRQAHLHHYLQKKELNNFYISTFLMNLGISLISIFVPIFLYNKGYSISMIIIFYFLWSFYYLIFLFPCAKFIGNIGAKHSILISIPFLILFYLGLNFIENYSFLFFILPLLNSFNTIFYWNGYHLNFLTDTKNKRMGKAVSIINILTLLAMSLAPFIGGFIADWHFYFLFGTGSFIILLSAIPLLRTEDNFSRDVNIRSVFSKFFRKHEKHNILAFSGAAIESVLQAYLWPIYLIIILGTITKTGFVVSLTTGISIIGIYFSGKMTDKFDKIKLLKVLTFFNFLGWILRIFANSFSKIIFIDTYKRLSERTLHVPWTAQLYNLSEREKGFEFILFWHSVYHISRIIVMPVIALIFYLNFYPFQITFIIAGFASLGYMFINKR